MNNRIRASGSPVELSTDYIRLCGKATAVSMLFVLDVTQWCVSHLFLRTLWLRNEVMMIINAEARDPAVIPLALAVGGTSPDMT